MMLLRRVRSAAGQPGLSPPVDVWQFAKHHWQEPQSFEVQLAMGFPCLLVVFKHVFRRHGLRGKMLWELVCKVSVKGSMCLGCLGTARVAFHESTTVEASSLQPFQGKQCMPSESARLVAGNFALLCKGTPRRHIVILRKVNMRTKHDMVSAALDRFPWFSKGINAWHACRINHRCRGCV